MIYSKICNRHSRLLANNVRRPLRLLTTVHKRTAYGPDYRRVEKIVPDDKVRYRSDVVRRRSA
jgi:hypothetical protein